MPDVAIREKGKRGIVSRVVCYVGYNALLYVTIALLVILTRLQCLLFKTSSSADVEAYTTLWLLVRIPYHMKGVLLNRTWDWWRSVFRAATRADDTGVDTRGHRGESLSRTAASWSPSDDGRDGADRCDRSAEGNPAPPGSHASGDRLPTLGGSYIGGVRVVSLVCDEDATCNNVVMVWFVRSHGPRQDSVESELLQRVAASTTHFRGLIVAEIATMQHPGPVERVLMEVESTLSAIVRYLEDHCLGDRPLLLPAASSLTATALLLFAERHEHFCLQNHVLGSFVIDPFVGWRLTEEDDPALAHHQNSSAGEPMSSASRPNNRSPSSDRTQPCGRGAASGMSPSCVATLRRSPSNYPLHPGVMRFVKRSFDAADKFIVSRKGTANAIGASAVGNSPHAAAGGWRSVGDAKSKRRSPPDLWSVSPNRGGLRSWFPDVERAVRSPIRSLFALHRYSMFAQDQAQFVDDTGSDWIVVCDASLSSEDTLLIVVTWMHDQALAMSPSIASSLGRSLATLPSSDYLHSATNNSISSSVDEVTGVAKRSRANGGVFSISTIGLRRFRSHDGVALRAADISGEDLPALRPGHRRAHASAPFDRPPLAGATEQPLHTGRQATVAHHPAAALRPSSQASHHHRLLRNAATATRGGGLCPHVDSMEDFTSFASGAQ